MASSSSNLRSKLHRASMASSSSNRRSKIPDTFLPFDVVGTILSKCPIEALVRLSTTNKQWHGFIYPRFIYPRLRRVQSFIRINTRDGKRRVEVVNTNSLVLRELPIPVAFRRAPLDVAGMVQCDGLVLCSFRGCSNPKQTLAIWNPCLSEARWIDPPLSGFTPIDFFGFGYGYDKDDYKILRFLHLETRDSTGWGWPDEVAYLKDRKKVKERPEADIFNFRTGEWKTIAAKRERKWRIEPWCKGLCVKGNMFWVAGRMKRRELYLEQPFLLCFDFSSETFKKMSDCPNPGNCHLRLGLFQEDRISLLRQANTTNDIDLWVTDAGDLGTFSLLFTLDHHPRIPRLHTDALGLNAHPVYTVSKNQNSIVVWFQEGFRHGFCEIDARGERNFSVTSAFHGRRYPPPIVGFVYFPSRAPLPADPPINRVIKLDPGAEAVPANSTFDITPAQEKCLSRLKSRIDVAYDSTIPLHQEALKELWKLSFPEEELHGLISEQWKQMGWRGNDPSTDFQGGGFTYLENLLYFARNFQESFQDLLRKQVGNRRGVWVYPFAVAGIYLTSMLIQMLDLKAVKPRTIVGATFLKFLSENEYAFDLLYCIAFKLMDQKWHEMRLPYMEFDVTHTVILITREQLERERADAGRHKASWGLALLRSSHSIALTIEEEFLTSLIITTRLLCSLFSLFIFNAFRLLPLL